MLTWFLADSWLQRKAIQCSLCIHLYNVERFDEKSWGLGTRRWIWVVLCSVQRCFEGFNGFFTVFPRESSRKAPMVPVACPIWLSKGWWTLDMWCSRGYTWVTVPVEFLEDGLSFHPALDGCTHCRRDCLAGFDYWRVLQQICWRRLMYLDTIGKAAKDSCSFDFHAWFLWACRDTDRIRQSVAGWFNPNLVDKHLFKL